MGRHFHLKFPLFLSICALVGCGYVEDKIAITRLKPTKDPVLEEIYAFRVKIRQLYNSRHFGELETTAAELRRTKPLFDNGSWKIAEFYDSFSCRSSEPESMWQLHDRIHQDWIAQFPMSITARIAYADFFTDYAWHARGTDFADKVTEEGWRLFAERIGLAQKTLAESSPRPSPDAPKVSAIVRCYQSNGALVDPGRGSCVGKRNVRSAWGHLSARRLGETGALRSFPQMGQNWRTVTAPIVAFGVACEGGSTIRTPHSPISNSYSPITTALVWV